MHDDMELWKSPPVSVKVKYQSCLLAPSVSGLAFLFLIKIVKENVVQQRVYSPPFRSSIFRRYLVLPFTNGHSNYGHRCAGFALHFDKSCFTFFNQDFKAVLSNSMNDLERAHAAPIGDDSRHQNCSDIQRYHFLILMHKNNDEDEEQSSPVGVVSKGEFLSCLAKKRLLCILIRKRLSRGKAVLSNSVSKVDQSANGCNNFRIVDSDILVLPQDDSLAVGIVDSDILVLPQDYSKRSHAAPIAMRCKFQNPYSRQDVAVRIVDSDILVLPQDDSVAVEIVDSDILVLPQDYSERAHAVPIAMRCKFQNPYSRQDDPFTKSSPVERLSRGKAVLSNSVSKVDPSANGGNSFRQRFAIKNCSDIQPLIQRYHFLISMYKHHSIDEDEVIGNTGRTTLIDPRCTHISLKRVLMNARSA
ncbi:unnamed protein product [Sphenostylis stenocarpa]|uniref:Uncharacterized protein n=1 Tax=Sphenostylis stenocarpa TaxID=92480 RepID=A0AA86SB53_9FABA|nr:unnamed protein product [Sphenostylis stenocarpa]